MQQVIYIIISTGVSIKSQHTVQWLLCALQASALLTPQRTAQTTSFIVAQRETSISIRNYYKACNYRRPARSAAGQIFTEMAQTAASKLSTCLCLAISVLSMSMTVRASLYGLPRKFWRIWHLESRQNIVRILASGAFDGNAESVTCASIYLGVLQKSPDFWWTYSHKESIIPLPEIYIQQKKQTWS